MRRKQYSTGGQIIRGYKRCNYCEEIIPGGTSCKCHVTITLKGEQEVIKATLEKFASTLEFIEADEESKEHIDTGEARVTAVFKAPGVPFGPFLIRPGE